MVRPLRRRWGIVYRNGTHMGTGGIGVCWGTFQVRKVGWGSKSCSTFDWLRGPQNARNMTAADGCASNKHQKSNNAMHPLLRAVSLSSALPRFLQYIVRKGFPLTRGLRGLVASTFSRVRERQECSMKVMNTNDSRKSVCNLCSPISQS